MNYVLLEILVIGNRKVRLSYRYRDTRTPKIEIKIELKSEKYAIGFVQSITRPIIEHQEAFVFMVNNFLSNNLWKRKNIDENDLLYENETEVFRSILKPHVQPWFFQYQQQLSVLVLRLTGV